MRHRSRATLGPIVQSLLAVGLCTLVAAAQQPAAAPAPAGAAAATHVPNAKTRDAAAEQTTHDASSDDHSTGVANTGVANPDPVTPDTSSSAASDGQNTTQPAANATPAPNYIDNSDPIPAAESGDGSLLQEGATAKRFSPDQPSRPITPELDSDKPAPPDPAPAASAQSGATVLPSQQPSPAAPSMAGQTIPAAPDDATPPAQTPATSPAPAPASAPDATAPQQTAPLTPAAPQQSEPMTPDSATPPAQTPATSPAPTPVQPRASAPDATAPQQTAPSTTPAPADSSAAPQRSAPATPDSATPPAQTPPHISCAATTFARARCKCAAAGCPVTPPADSSAPQQNAPEAPPASPDATPVPGPTNTGTPQGTDTPTATPPAADTNTPAPDAAAPASASQDQAPAAPQAPAPADNTAVNPSLPAPQVNAPEPPPASRFDIFGGYTYLRPSGSVGIWSFPSNNTRGYIASGTYYFNRHFGVQAEFQHSEYPLGTTGSSPAPPFVQLGGVTDSFYTAEAGPVYRFFLGQHFIPFAHFTAGGAKVAGPKFQPLTWGYGFAGGGGVDVLLPHTGEHVAFRVVQADYGYMHADQGALQKYDLAGGTQNVSALRLSAGLVFRLGEMNPVQSKSLACDASPSEVYAGERVTLAATLRNYRDKTKNPFFFRWELSAGKQQGFGPVIFVDTTGLGEGTYHATAHISAKEKGRQFAQCSANFVVKASPAPTLKCSADPSTVTPGEVSIITAYAASIAQRQLTYGYTTSEGQMAARTAPRSCTPMACRPA